MAQRINPETGELEEGHWLFGRFVPGMKVPTKGKARTAGSGRSHKKKPEPGEDVAPEGHDGLKLPSRPSMAKDIGQAIEGYNTLLLMLPWTANDALTQGEAERLVYGLDEAQKANRTIRKYVQRGAQGSGVFALAIACAGIALSRMAAHGWLPGTRKLDPDEYAAARAEQERMYEAMRKAGMGPPIVDQEPIVPPVYSNGNGTTPFDGPIVYTR